MGFFVDIGTCWVLGVVFWVILRIFAYAYITLWRFFGWIFSVRGAIHYRMLRMLSVLFRVPHVYYRDDIEAKISVRSVSILTRSPVRAFLFTFLPLLAGTSLIFVIRMYLGDGTTERLIIQIVLIVLLLIVIVPSPTEMKFVIKTIFAHPFITIKEVLILGTMTAVYVWESEWISMLPIFNTYLFEFGLLVVGFFAIEFGLWILKHLLKRINERIFNPRQVRAKPLNPPKSVLKTRKKHMYPGREALREERGSLAPEAHQN